MDRDLWIAIGLFALGVVAFSFGYALVLDLGIEYLPGVGVTLAGGVLLGLSGAAAFRWKTGSVSRRRILALVGSFLAMAAGNVTASVLVSERIAVESFLLFFIPVFLYWLYTYRTETGANRTDERKQLLAYKAGFWTLIVIVGLVTIGMVIQEVTTYSVPSETILEAIGAIGLFGWYGAFHYLQTHN